MRGEDIRDGVSDRPRTGERCDPSRRAGPVVAEDLRSVLGLELDNVVGVAGIDSPDVAGENLLNGAFIAHRSLLLASATVGDTTPVLLPPALAPPGLRLR
jgi:hypothetical protein